MKALVVGYGSIGTRHAKLLDELGVQTAVVSSREIGRSPSYRTLGDGVREAAPDYVVLANATSEHLGSLQALASLGFKGTVLVEKPLFCSDGEGTAWPFKNIFVGYNLRLHPLLLKLKALLAGEKVLSVQCYVGKHLSQWRPDTDYRRSYSARRSAGGGVLRDLSHELDYLLWLLGPWKRLAAIGGRFGDLDIESDDAYGLLMEFGECPLVTLQMNYLDRVPTREIVAVTANRSFRADLIGGTIRSEQGTERFEVDPDLTYRLEHQAILAGKTDGLCSYKEGMEVLRMIDAAEKAVKEKIWVS